MNRSKDGRRGNLLRGAQLSTGPRRNIRSSGYIDPSNVEVYKSKVGEPRDRGMRDHMRLQSLLTTALKLVYRTGRGKELDEKIKEGAQYHEDYKSEQRALNRELNPPSAFGRTPEIDWISVEKHRDNIKRIQKELTSWNKKIGGDLIELIGEAVNEIFSGISSSDSAKIANIKSFDELPDLASLPISSVDEAELLSDIFFKNKTEKATPGEVLINIENIVGSFIELDTARMEDEDNISYIVNRLKTVTKNASENRSELKKPTQSYTNPHAGYMRHEVNVKTKKDIQKAIRDGDFERAKTLLVDRPDLADAVGRRSEADIIRSYINRTPLSEGYTFRYDVIVENLLRKYR